MDIRNGETIKCWWCRWHSDKCKNPQSPHYNKFIHDMQVEHERTGKYVKCAFRNKRSAVSTQKPESEV